MSNDYTREAMRDAKEMERWSILDDDADDESELPEHKRSDYMERRMEAADAKRKEIREESL